MYDVIVYSGTVLPALGPFKKISLSGYSTLPIRVSKQILHNVQYAMKGPYNIPLLPASSMQ